MNWLTPDWPAPASVKACVSTREGGVSEAPFDSSIWAIMSMIVLRLWPRTVGASPITSLYSLPGCSKCTELPWRMRIRALLRPQTPVGQQRRVSPARR